MRTLIVPSIATLVLLAACGDDDSADTSSAPESSPAAIDNSSAPEPTAVETSVAVDTSAAPVDTTVAGGAEPAAGPVTVELAEWSLTVDKELTAGTVEFVVNNVGQFPHELAVIKGDSYATLPLSTNGAVDEAALEAGALVGRSDRINGGGSATVSFDLEATMCWSATSPSAPTATLQPARCSTSPSAEQSGHWRTSNHTCTWPVPADDS
jgi:hypothetical protein